MGKIIKKSVYLDTTIPSYYFDDRIELAFQTRITKKWFEEESGNYQISLSDITIGELNEGEFPNKTEIIKFASQFELLSANSQINSIAELYIQNQLMPKEIAGDAMHLAYSSFYKIDFLLTWNCNHLANANKKAHIRVVNSKLNLSIPEIITPLELFKETREK